MNESTVPPNVSPKELRRGRDLLTLPVYTIADGKSLGVIDTLFVQPGSFSVPWVSLKTGTLSRNVFLPYAAFQTVGVDIALVPTDAAVREEIPTDEKSALDTGLTGRPVMTHSGQQVGSIAGFEIDTVSGKIVGFQVRAVAGFFHKVVAAVRDDTVFVTPENVASLGPDAVILVPEAATLFAEPN